MAFVKGFDINGINTIQTACIELQAPPNAATEGAVGLLAIDMSSPTKDVYKCVAVNGAIYTWELLSSGMSILNSSESGEGSATATFTYSALRMTDKYVVKVGDLILDSKGYLYRIIKLNNTNCITEYCNLYLNRNGVGISKVEQKLLSDESGTTNRVTLKLTDGSNYSFDVKNGQTAFELAKEKGYEGTEEEWLDNLGYGSWLKGKAVTQEEYDALSDEEKNKHGYLYVIKDAEIHTHTADSLTLTSSYTYEITDDNSAEINIPGGKWYLINFDPNKTEGELLTGVIYVPLYTFKDFTASSTDMGDLNFSYACRIHYNGYSKICKISVVAKGTSGSSFVKGIVTLIPMGQ